MFVIKRSGQQEPFMINKIINRIVRFNYGLETEIVLNLNNRVYSGISTAEIDDLIAEIAIKMNYKHPNYEKIASRILTNNIYKRVPKTFSEAMKNLNEITDDSNERTSLLADDVYEIIQINKELFDSEINHENDLYYDYFSFKALQAHLIKINDQPVERPQHMLMRTAIGIHKQDIESAIESYKLMSQRWFIHDSNTLLNAGTSTPVLLSSFALTIKDDSLPGIYDTLKQTAIILKNTNNIGNIGLNLHCIRSANSYIAGSMGHSNGLVPMLKVFNESCNYLCQNDFLGNKPYTVYLEPWHADVFEFLDLKKNTGEANLRASDLFYAMWIPDLFMERVKKDEHWSLMCPNQSPGLQDVYGDEFVKLYEQYEKTGNYRKQIKARNLWNAIISSQIDASTPYILYKDHCNHKSNQKNLGTIKGSNSSAEIVQYSSSDEIAVCQSASIALHKFVTKKTRKFDFDKLREVTKIVTKNLNKIIDITNYPLKEMEKSNKSHRPIGISVQGLADTFILMRYPFDSVQANDLSTQIFETIYYASLEASCELAKLEGYYQTYPGSPASVGQLQYDLWNLKATTDLWNWQELKNKIKQYGLRNSLLVAPFSSKYSHQILGCNQCCEALASNIEIKRINSNEFKIINQYLLDDIVAAGLCTDQLMDELMKRNGSIQDIDNISDDLKQIYKTVCEIPTKVIINMTANRAAFIDQSEALNINISELTSDKLTSFHFYVWNKGLKTGLYQLNANLR